MSELEFVWPLSFNTGETQNRSPFWLHIFNKAQILLLTAFYFALCRVTHTCIKLLSPVLLLWASAKQVKALEKQTADKLKKEVVTLFSLSQ